MTDLHTPRSGDDPGVPSSAAEPARFTRRRVLTAASGALAGVLAVGVGGVELVDHRVLPGKLMLDQLLGYCHVPAPRLGQRAPGYSRSGSFFSKARNQTVGYKLAYPPEHGPGSRLPLILALHGYGGDHKMNIGHLSLQDSLAATYRGVSLPPMAMIAVDGGGLYWNAHPGDDPMAMLVDEVIPMCQQLGLGSSDPIGSIGISMGGYGALLLAEKNPQSISAVAAVSPAIWTSYAQARTANAGAYASAADFISDDAVTHAWALANIPVRIASGIDDPFHPGVVAMEKASPDSVRFHIGRGCHAGSFWTAQAHPSLVFLGQHLSSG